MTPEAKRNRTRILLAFAAVYFIWGSTYLFIKYAIETIPPFLVGASRFLVAGALLYGIARWRGAPAPTAADWRTAFVTGVLMLGFGNGAVVWSEQTVPSGQVALIVSTVPIWIVLMDWWRPHGVRPKASVFFGLALGLVGMIILVGPRAIIGDGHLDELGALALFLGSLSWALGTIITRVRGRQGSLIVFSALQTLSASVAMFVMAAMSGEFGRLSLSAIDLRGALSWVYLVLAGSLIGFTAYVYLLDKVSAAKASTYAYVNPIIAVLLGWAFANESISMRTIVAAAVILAGVALITTLQSSSSHATGEHPLPHRPKEKERTAA
jgi:drug/metabolite transporter (DMT)-like permease